MSKENKLLDVFKYTAALLVLASHCLPLVPNESINFFYAQWFFRFCVPFFIISSGYFFASFETKGKIKYIKRIAVLYIISSLIYIPTYINESAYLIKYSLVFGYHHLWYLCALIIALCLCLIFENIPFINKLYQKLYPLAAVLLIAIGSYYDEYRYVFTSLSNFRIVGLIGKWVNYLGGPRHALFFALPMLLIGKFIYEHKSVMKLSKVSCIVLTIISFGVSLAECVMLRHFGGELITCDVTLFNYLPAIFLFILTFVYSPKFLEKIKTKTLRKNSDIIYISHVLVLFFVDKLTHFTYMTRFLLTLVLSIIVSWLYVKITDYIKAKKKKA